MPLPDLLSRRAEETSRLLALSFLQQASAARARLSNPEDVEALHDFRVGIRRLRSCFRAYRPQLKGSVGRRDRRRFRSVARATGESRDLQVHREWVLGQRDGLSPRQQAGVDWLLARLDARKLEADRRLQGTVVERFDRLAKRVGKRISVYRTTVRLDGSDRERFADAVVGRLTLQMAGDLESSLASVRSAADETQAHRVRILAKRLRYLLEPLQDNIEGAPEIVGRLKDLQDVLGEFHDAHVFADELSDALEEASVEHARQLSRDLLEWGESDPVEERSSAPDARPGLLALARLLRQRGQEAFGRFKPEWLDGAADDFFKRVAELARGLTDRARVDIEIERKFLLSGLPPEVESAPALEIEQGWLPGTRLQERIRRVRFNGDEHWYRTIKSGSGMSRIELEEATSGALFQRIWPLTEGRRVTKRRRQVQAGDLVWEIDEFPDRGLVLAEVELPSAETPVQLPEWLRPYVVREVTGEKEFLNVTLAH